MLLLTQLANTLHQVSSGSSTVEQCRSFVNPNASVVREPGSLHSAIMAGKPTLLRHLLDEGLDPNEVYGGKTPLNLCMCFCNSLETAQQVKLLIKYGANVNLLNPLHTACQRGLTSVIGVLIENGASTESLDRNSGFTPLQYTLDLLRKSISETRTSMLIEVAQTLLQYKQLDVTNCGLYGSSPLQLAVLTSQPSIVSAIISKGGHQLPLTDVQMALQLMQTNFNGPVDARDRIIAELSRLNTKSVPSLQELSRAVIRQTLSRRLSGVRELPCSNHLKRFLKDRAKFDCSRDAASNYLNLF